MVFVDALKVEFGRDVYVAKVPLSNLAEGICVMNLSSQSPSINLCVQTTEGKCSLWRYSLQDEDIQFHMEETVGIYDPEGLLAYAAYFRDALVIGVTMDYIPKVDNSSNGKLDLVLQYKISTLTLEGRLQFTLVQEDVDNSAYAMMVAAYDFDSTCKIAIGTRNTSIIRKTKQAHTANSTRNANNDGIIANSGDEDEQLNETTDETSSNNVQISTSAANTAAMKAKKRRIGGVNIFPGMRKK